MRSVVAIAALVAGLWLASKGYGAVLVVALVAALFLSRKSTPKVAGAGRGSNPLFGGRGRGEMKDDARWSTSVHEAAHVVAVRRNGGSASAWVSADGRKGGYRGSLPDRAPAIADAVVHLAGGIAQRKIVGRDGPSASDVRQAKAVLRGTGVSFAEAEREAARLVSGNRGAILRDARKLDGRS